MYNSDVSTFRIFQSKSKPAKKKPGWQQRAAAYDAWLASVQNQQLGLGRSPVKGKIAAKDLVVPATPVVSKDRTHKHLSRIEFGGTAGKPVARPDILYKDDPDMLARELAARQVKHNTAPAYNKGPDQFVTQEELTNQLKGNKRRV